MTVAMDLKCTELKVWKEGLDSYQKRLQSLGKPHLCQLDDFYRKELPSVLQTRRPKPYLTKSELSNIMQWKLSRGKWRPQLQKFVSSLCEEDVEVASRKAFESLPDLSKAVSELTTLKGVGPATASAILAAFAPETAPFMSDEAMESALGGIKAYNLKQYLILVERLQDKAKELSMHGMIWTPSDVERAMWSAAVGGKDLAEEGNAKVVHKTKRQRH